MKIAAELRIKHGILYEACQQHGGIKPFAAKIGIGHQTLFRWLHMRRCPTPGVFNQWYTKKVEKRLEKLTGVSAQELFPKQLKEFTELDRPARFVSVKDIEIKALEWMAEDLSDRLTSSDPASDAITSELREKVQAAVAKLPERQRLIIDARFHRGLTLEETGHELRITRERVRQGELKAIRLLRESNAFSGFED